jgi:hypothetical protein
MSKAASLRPVKRPYLVALNKAPWELSIPPELSETGKRHRMFFATEREARAAAEHIKVRKANFGTSLGNLTSTTGCGSRGLL